MDRDWIGVAAWVLIIAYAGYLHLQIAILKESLKSAKEDASRWRERAQAWNSHWWELHDKIARGGEELATYQRNIWRLMHKTESRTSSR